MTPTPGLSKKNIVQYSSVKKTALTSSSSAKAASTSGLASAQKVSIFTRPLGGRSSRGAGWVAGQRNFNPYDRTTNISNRNQRLREEARMNNSGYYENSNMYSNASYGYGNMNDGMGAAMGVQMGMQMAQGIFGMLNQFGVFGNNNTSSSGGGTSLRADSVRTEGGGTIRTASSISNPEVSGFVSGMNGARNSVDLRSAIGEAESKLSGLNSDLGALKTASEGAISARTQLTEQKEAKLGELAKVKGELKDVTGDKNQASKAQKTAKENLASKAKGASSACEAYATAKGQTQAAKSALSGAESQLAAAKTALDNTPELLADGKPNPARAAAEANLTAAEAKVAEAKAKVAKCEEQQAAALVARDDALQAQDIAEEDVDQAENSLATLVKQEETVKKKVENLTEQETKLNGELGKLQAEIDSRDGIILKYEQAKVGVEQLKSQIDTQKQRLEQLVNDEKNQAQSLKEQNQQLASSINGAVDTRKERKATEQIGKNNTQISQNELRAIYTALANDSTKIDKTAVDGTVFRTDGTHYMVNSQVVNSEEYNEAKSEHNV